MKILLSSLDRWEGWDPEVFLIIIFMVLPLPSSSEEIWVSVFYSFLCLPPSPDLRRAPRSPPLAVMTLRSLSHSLSVTGWTRKVTWWNAGISISSLGLWQLKNFEWITTSLHPIFNLQNEGTEFVPWPSKVAPKSTSQLLISSWFSVVSSTV